MEVIKALINKGEAVTIKRVYNSMIPKWQKKALKGLEEAGEKEILSILTVGINTAR